MEGQVSILLLGHDISHVIDLLVCDVGWGVPGVQSCAKPPAARSRVAAIVKNCMFAFRYLTWSKVVNLKPGVKADDGFWERGFQGNLYLFILLLGSKTAQISGILEDWVDLTARLERSIAELDWHDMPI